MRIVVESPLGSPYAEGRRRHLRFALWCCRALELQGHDPICSHVAKPWWLDDTIPSERQRGIDSEWFWLGDPHMFFVDLGNSRGMQAAAAVCEKRDIRSVVTRLQYLDAACWAAYLRGDWPPHTDGFEVAP